MQIAHRKTQTDHKMLSDRTDALAARVDAVQADLHGAIRGDDDEVDALRTRVQAAEDLLSQLQGRLSATEVALVDAKVQAAAAAAEIDDANAEGDTNNVNEGEGESVRACRRLGNVPPRKRTRRYARAAVQTTAAVVVGAVAAWSALAFV